MIIFYIATLLILTVFSFGLVDANFPTKLIPSIFEFVHSQRSLATVLYIGLMMFLFAFYFWILGQIQQKNLSGKSIWKLIGITALILFVSFPAFSYDIINYIATAKVTYLYRENPYVVMPIEIANEPMLAFLHAANKVALYGPTWIGLAVLPYAIGMAKLLMTVYAFKALILLFYLGLSWTVWKISGKNIRNLAFFAFNPIVITETLVSGHNDVVMMFLALTSFLLAKKKRFWIGFTLLVFSVLVKGATVVLVALYFILWLRTYQGKTVNWQKIWYWAAILLLGIFFLTPIREELYPWYFIWPLTFISLLPKNHFLQFLSYGFSFGLPLRFAPFIYYGDWGGIVPLIKKIVSFVPPLVSGIAYVEKKNH